MIHVNPHFQYVSALASSHFNLDQYLLMVSGRILTGFGNISVESLLGVQENYFVAVPVFVCLFGPCHLAKGSGTSAKTGLSSHNGIITD